MQIQPSKLVSIREDSWADTEQQDEQIDLERVFGMVRRQWRLVALITLAFLVLGLVYLFTATPLYTAQTSVLMDRGSNAVLTQLSDINSVFDDEPSVLSQVELLQSQTIARAVVIKNKLDEDPDFMASTPSLMRSVRGLVRNGIAMLGLSGTPDAPTGDEIEARRAAATGKIMGNIDVARAGRTYVLQINYTSPSPELAARVANAIGDAYIEDKLDSKYEATRRATDWMQQRISELRERALSSDAAVQRFRTANNIVSTGTQLLTDQQLFELNSAYIEAQGMTASARAKSEELDRIMAAGNVEAIVPEVLLSPTITDLRQRYLEVAKRRSELIASLGPNHIQVQRRDQEMAEYESQMWSEVARIAAGAKSALGAAESKEKGLAAQVALATGVSTGANEQQVQLRELEREAETYSNLYKSFLDRYQQAIQQQSFPITDARIISSATLPDRASSPKTALILGLFLVMGAAAGSMLAGLREYRDRFFRTGEQLRDELGLELLGIAPLVEDARLLPLTKTSNNDTFPAIRKSNSLANYVIEHPHSAFAEGLRAAKIAADLTLPDKPCKIIGVVSTLPDEGKSTISVNFAELLAMSGRRTLLIDCDLRNPGMTRMLGSHATAGLIEVLLEGRPLETVVQRDPQTNLAFLPAVVKQRIPHSSELLSSAEMQKLLSRLSGSFDYIIIDLPPLAPVIDTRAMAPLIDGFLFVVEWGQTARRTVRQMLRSEPAVADKCLGVILNKVDMDKMKLYRTYGSIEHYFSRYSKYYHEN